MERGVGQRCSPKQVILLFARWKLGGFLSDLPGKRCDTVLKRFCLFGLRTLHRASPQLGGGSAILSVADGCRWRGGDLGTISPLYSPSDPIRHLVRDFKSGDMSKREQRHYWCRGW